MDWSLTLPGGEVLSAEGVFTATLVSGSAVDINVSITNTTLASLHERVASVGFQTNPAVTASFLTAGSVFDALGNNVTFPSFQTIDVCAFAGRNCSGGAFSALLAPGATDRFTLHLAGDFGSTPLVLDTFAIKFQGDLGSYQFAAVPMPATLFVLGGGLLMLRLLRRRRCPPDA